MIKKLMLAGGGLALVMTAVLWAQGASPMWLYVWSGGPKWLTLGPTLTATNGQIDVSLPPAPTRKYGVRLTYDASVSGWHVPNGATNVVVWVNGLRYDADDYAISSAGLITAKAANILPEHKVLVDYDER